jgi:hypothetical protein
MAMKPAQRLTETYVARREAQERAAAAGSDDPSAKMVHLDLARRYAAMLPRAVG